MRELTIAVRFDSGALKAGSRAVTLVKLIMLGRAVAYEICLECPNNLVAETQGNA